MTTGKHVIWNEDELARVAEAYLGLPLTLGYIDRVFEAQKRVLPEERWHPRSWGYPQRNKKLLADALAKLKLRLANRPPPPPAAKPAAQEPKAASQPPVPGGVSAAQAGGDLGATLERLFERLGEAFGRGFTRTATMTVSPIAGLRAAGEEYLSDPDEAARNAAEREAVLEAERVGLPARPKVLVLGGIDPDHADLRRELGDAVDLRCVSASRRKVRQALSHWNGSPVIVWTRYCSHGLLNSAKSQSQVNFHYVPGSLSDVLSKVKELTADGRADA